MQLSLTHDADVDAWFLSHEDVRIETPADIDAWRDALMKELEKLGGQRAYILIDLGGFTLAPGMAEPYGKVAKTVVSQYALGVVRFGSDDGSDLTTTAIRLGAVMNRFPANVFPNREVALQVLERIRGLPASPPAP
jgi:hypothetical protein